MVANINRTTFDHNLELEGLFLKDKYTEANNSKKKTERLEVPPEKQFIPRNSLLTDLFEVKHICSIYHMFIAVLMISFMNSAVSDALNDGQIRLGFRYLEKGFGQLSQAFTIWIFMFLATLFIYPMFCLWASGRSKKFKRIQSFWDTLWLSGFILYLITFVYISLIMKSYSMPLASSSIVLMEQIRLLMKMHAFIRTNAGCVLKGSDTQTEFSTFLYFLFAPTFIYREHYPRTDRIRWDFIIYRLLEIIGCIFMISFIVEHYLVVEFNLNLQQQGYGARLASVFRTILPSSMMMLCGFYLLLHAWLNIWAELLRFADRLFYSDWWNAQSFSVFYRTWNIVVHDYLFTYIYRDCLYLFLHTKYRKIIATVAVFFTSAIVHEYIIGFMLGFCYPVLLVEFLGLGMALAFVKKSFGNFGNVFIWWSLALGVGLMTSFYSVEMSARIDSKITNWNDYFVPKSWTYPL